MTNLTHDRVRLESAAIGHPITRLGVSFFPIYLPDNELPAIETGAGSKLEVEELDSASVNDLRVRNPGDKPVLVVEGEHFLGAKQNRSINVSVLVPSLRDLTIPVSCFERGRWGRPRPTHRDDIHSPPALRARRNATVAESMRQRGSRQGDQGAVWHEVNAMLDRSGVHSPTASASDVRQSAHYRTGERLETVEDLVRRGPLPGQCGFVVSHGHWVRGMDLFGAAELLRAHWSALVRSHFVEPACPDTRPSATRALSLVRRFALAPGERSEAVGLGKEYRVTDRRLNGHALTWKRSLVHAAFFTPNGSGGLTAGAPPA